MAVLTAGKVIRRIRQRLELSQEGLSRLLNATKGAVQHWERGRNNPDLARLLAMRQLCPPGAEKKVLDALIRQAQAEAAPLATGGQSAPAGKGGAGSRPRQAKSNYSREGLTLLHGEKERLQRQIATLEMALHRRTEQVRILEALARDLQREIAAIRATQPAKFSTALSH